MSLSFKRIYQRQWGRKRNLALQQEERERERGQYKHEKWVINTDSIVLSRCYKQLHDNNFENLNKIGKLLRETY